MFGANGNGRHQAKISINIKAGDTERSVTVGLPYWLLVWICLTTANALGITQPLKDMVAQAIYAVAGV